MTVDGRIERGNKTRRTVLAHTAKVASAEGLESLSLGRLAVDLQLSKSGVFALFGSKEELQLATVRAAGRIFADRVVEPALGAPPGLPRLQLMCSEWIRYSRERVFPGGCFFQTVIAEYGSRRGPVCDLITQIAGDWRRYVHDVVQEARNLGQLAADTDTEQLAFELTSLLTSANTDSLLLGSDRPYDLAERAIRDRLEALAGNPS